MRDWPRIIFVLCVLFFNKANAQSLYDVKFTSNANQGIRAVGFLVRYLDGSGYIRLHYYNDTNKTDEIVNWDTKETLTDSTNMDLSLLNPVIISSFGKGAINYKPDHIIFKLLPGKDFFQIAKVGSVNEARERDFLMSKEMTENMINTTFLREYFLPTDTLFQSYLNSGRGDVPLPKSTAKMHVFFVADMVDPILVKDSKRDSINIVNFYNNIRLTLNIPCFYHFITRDKYDKSMLLNEFKAFKPDTNDIVIFHYTGHGFHQLMNPIFPKNEDLDSFPNLFLHDMNNTIDYKHFENISLNLSSVYKILVSKGARLNLIMGDCCNNNISNSGKEPCGEIPSGRDGMIPDPLACKQLFIDQKLSILVSSTRAGQKSESNAQVGSVFTHNYIQSVNGAISKHFKNNKNWDTIFETSETANEKTLRSFRSDEPGRCYSMTPIIKIQK